MITIQVTRNKKKIFIDSHYYYKSRLAKIPGAMWNPNMKMWVAPFSSMKYIQDNFEGEIYYKTPKWFIDGIKPEPEKRELYDKSIKAPKLKLPLYDYQEQGVEFMIDRINKYGFVLNSDSVGLGKTACTLATLKWYIENRGAKHILIICKKSIKLQWKSEIKKFTDWDMPIFVSGGTPKKREKTYTDMKESDSGILITNYHNYLNDVDKIKQCKFDICVIDEVHSVKARNGKQHDGIASVVNGKKLILISGTPLMAHIDDIYGIFGIADKYYFGSYKSFEKQYLVVEFGIYGRQVVGAKNIDELYEKIHDVMIRRTAAEVAIQLPEVVVQSVPIEMDKTQEKMQSILEEKKDIIKSKKETLLNNEPLTEEIKAEIEKINEKEKQYIAAQQFVADNPICFKYLKESKINKELLEKLPKNYSTSSKNEATIDLVEDILGADEKVIIFTHFLVSALVLKEEIEKKLNTTVLMYTGREDEETRDRNVKAFTTSGKYNILIGNEAMAEGLNLQSAKFLINYEQADTHAQKEQRMGRIRRVGSDHNNVVVYDMITQDSFDEVKMQKIAKDKELVNSLIG